MFGDDHWHGDPWQMSELLLNGQNDALSRMFGMDFDFEELWWQEMHPHHDHHHHHLHHQLHHHHDHHHDQEEGREDPLVWSSPALRRPAKHLIAVSWALATHNHAQFKTWKT